MVIKERVFWTATKPVIVAVDLVLAAWVLATTAHGPLPVLLGEVLFVMVAWRLVDPASFRHVLAWPMRGRWRRWWVYGRRWRAAMLACRLATRIDGDELLPRLRCVRSRPGVDRVTVGLLAGQVPADYVAVADRLAQTFGVIDCRVQLDPRRSGRICLLLVTRDPLAATVPPLESIGPPNLEALPVGVDENRNTFNLRLLGTHLLVVGATGAGKSSVVWSLIRALAPGVASGLVALWVIDPKGGMELAPGRRLFSRFAPSEPDPGSEASAGVGGEAVEFAQVLENAVAVMRTRQARLRGVTRLHQPTPADPLIVVVIDELASLTAYVTDRDAKKRIAAALSLLLSQGRAVGVSVVAALQDPRKEVLPARDLFPTRIGLRMVEPDQVDMVLGDGARRRGAACDRIPESLPGVGYVALDGHPIPTRVRFCWVSDTDIEQTATAFDPLATAWTAAPCEAGPHQHPENVGTADSRGVG